MTLRKRIILIIIGFIIFLGLGPVIIFMAQGYRYDFRNGNLLVTGTLVVKTEPRGADVFLNGEKINSTPLIKRFLAPNEYLVEVTKPGYRPWRKTVNVFDSQVSFLPDQYSKISLLLEENIEIKKTEEVSDMFAYEDLLFYIDQNGQHIFASAFNAANTQLVASSTNMLTNPKFIDARKIGVGTEFIISSGKDNIYITSERETVLPRLENIEFGENAGTVLGLNTKRQLVEIDEQGAHILQNEVLSFKRKGSQIYYLKKNTLNEFWLGRMSSRSNQDLIQTPVFTKGGVIVSSDNQLYLILDRDLYSVKEKLEKINSSVTFAYWDAHGDFLVYGDAHETWTYDQLAESSNRLLVRSEELTTLSVYHKLAGYTFVLSGNEIKAIETDSSGQPNVYLLLAVSDPKKISLNDEGNLIAVLDGKKLSILQIR